MNNSHSQTIPPTPPLDGASLLVAEFLTGGGWLAECGSEELSPSLLREGAAMLAALAGDALALDRAPCVPLDARFLEAKAAARLQADGSPGFVVDSRWRTSGVFSASQEREELERLAATCAWSIVLAPETAGWLLRRAEWVDAAGGRRLGCSLADLALAGDKQLTAERLAQHRVPVPQGGLIAPGEEFPPSARFPIVVKPRDGAGSTDTFYIASPAFAPAILTRFAGAVRWETFCPGRAASVACLCGPGLENDSRRVTALPACRQDVRLDEASGEGRLTYHGGSLPLPGELDARARRLAERAVRTLDAPLGWVGVDLILGDADDGSQDVVIEINPRYTTSLVGLRAALGVNLLEAAIQIAEGRPTPALDEALSRPPRTVEFDPDGTVRRL
ncbi:MAG TPA: ATP-grasp domain-containing protein [Pirellulales bacterium]